MAMKRFEVTYKRRLNSNMVWLKIYAPLVARKARPGQFIIPVSYTHLDVYKRQDFEGCEILN